MSNAVARQVSLMTMLPRRGWLSVEEASKRLRNLGHPVSVRTVQRDLVALAKVITVERHTARHGVPGGWRWPACSACPACGTVRA